MGRSGLSVSRLAFGTMTFGKEADRPTARLLFDRCRAAGINLFDCANVYNDGASEEILGELIRDCRDEVIVTSKAGFGGGDNPNARGTSRYHLARTVEASLRRLATDRIDIFFLHRFDPSTPLEESLEALDIEVRRGRILYVGLSNFAAWQVATALGVAALRGLSAPAVIQPMYSLIRRQAEVELLPLAAAAGLGVVSYSPLASGMLTGKYSGGARPAGSRLAWHSRHRERYSLASDLQIADRLGAYAAERGTHPVTLALAWVASHPALTAPLIGARSLEQLEPALAAGELILTEEERAEISALGITPPPATDRTEEAPVRPGVGA